MDKIEQFVQAAGGITALAARLEVKPPTVYQWKSGDRPVPPRLALALCQHWPGIATVHDLRPDVFGPAPAGQADAA